MLMKGIVCLAALTALVGCKSVEELAKDDERACVSIGATVGSPTYVDCRLRLAEMRQNLKIAALNSSTTCNKVGTATVCD